jgi:hypothetical protein
MDALESEQVGSSSRSDGSRPLFNKIWFARVPLKVRVFAWRLTQEDLATQANRKSRGFERYATCQICEKEDESGFHAVMCPRAVLLRKDMRKVWSLPEERRLDYTGPDWLLHLVNPVDDEERAKALLQFWRAWHLRNDYMHGQGKATVEGSVDFLKSYVISLGWSNNPMRPTSSAKGKEKVWEGERSVEMCLRGHHLEGDGPRLILMRASVKIPLWRVLALLLGIARGRSYFQHGSSWTMWDRLKRRRL